MFCVGVVVVCRCVSSGDYFFGVLSGLALILYVFLYL
jgi:hypothetical protein